MLKRIGSIIIFLPVFLAALWFGGWAMQLLIALLSLCGIYEFARLYKDTENTLLIKSMYVITGAICALNPWLNYPYLIMAGLILILIVGSVYMIKKKIKLNDIALSILGFIYVTGLFGSLVEIRKENLHLLWMLLIIVFSTDTFAYLVGITLGRHKLIPAISPKKSVEGAIGGLIGCIILNLVYGVLWSRYFGFVYPLYFYGIVAFFGSILGQIGDLFASAIKREYGIKDFSRLIPGHGGILDRFDSMLIVAPLIYISPFLLKSIEFILVFN